MVDINVGMLSEAINEKADRDLENTQPLARTVIETFVNGTSGYRVWSDGYCEQWGRVDRSGTIVTIAFLKEFKDTNYVAFKNDGEDTVNTSEHRHCSVFNCTTKTMQTFALTGSTFGNWKATGYLAEGEY